VWCGDCYRRDESDNFQINELRDEDNRLMYDCESDANRYKRGINGAQLMIPFQCDLCIFRTLFKRNPTPARGDKENLAVIRRMNLDAMWSREPSTIEKNMRTLSNLISTCESSGFHPQLPSLGPFPAKDSCGFGVAFSMLCQSRRSGKHSKSYTQFATIRKQRSAFSNLYMASKEAAEAGRIIAQGAQSNAFVTNCPTNSMWFARWVSGCETRMGFVLKQNQAISVKVMRAIVESFKEDIMEAEPKSWERQKLCMGLAYTVICFFASLRGSECMSVDLQTLTRLFEKGNYAVKPKGELKPPHVIIPVKGRFKGEQGERCHLLPLANVSKSGVRIRTCVHLLIKARMEMHMYSPWAFVNREGKKMEFSEMNHTILEKLEELKEKDKDNKLGLKDFNVREDFSINRSFRRGSATEAQNVGISESTIVAQNRWRKIERAKGSRPKFTMIETYADVEQLIPTLVRYSAMM
jgi:hypothetical protein